MNNPVDTALAALEEIARAGRNQWEVFFDRLNNSDEVDEIEAFFAEWLQTREPAPEVTDDE